MSRRAHSTLALSILWVSVLTLVLAAHVVVAWQSVVTTRLWEDEAYNLTVPLNMVRGLGYTSDGMLSGWVLERSVLTPFDVRISTGPTVLLPIAALLQGAVWLGVPLDGATMVVIARIVPLVFWALLVSALAILGRRIAGRWGALTAIVVPLAFTAGESISPLRGPGDILGEVAVAALLAWAFVALRSRPWLAGLLLGFAVQAKYIALLAAPALVIACIILAAAPVKRWFAVIWRPAVFAILPTVLNELIALATLGLHGYGIRVIYTGGFIAGGGQQPQGTTVFEKLSALAQAWFVPQTVAWIVTVLAAAVLVCVAVSLRRGGSTRAQAPSQSQSQSSPSRELSAYFWGAVAVAGVYIGWWATASHTPLWVRHPAPGILFAAPILAAFVVLGLRMLAAETRVIQRAASVVGAVGLAAILVWTASAQLSLAFEPRDETLQTQSLTAQHLRAALPADAEWVAAHPWGESVSIGVMMNVHTGITDADSMAGAPIVTATDECSGLLAEYGSYQLCEGP